MSEYDDDRTTRSTSAEVTIQAPRERVWRALTEGPELERWFPLSAEVVPGADGSIFMSWGNEFSGSSRILAWDPPHHLRTTWGELDGRPEVQVTDYRLEGRGGCTVLRVVTSGFPADASWDEWVEGTVYGWAYELRSLAHYLERHDGQERRVLYLRRRAALPAEEVWRRLAGAEGWGDLAGRTLDSTPGRQRVVVLEQPPDALLRVSVEPTAVGAGQRDATLFASAWGDTGAALETLREPWRRRLAALFPDGTDPDTA